jgi:hypothetical protein
MQRPSSKIGWIKPLAPRWGMNANDNRNSATFGRRAATMVRAPIACASQPNATIISVVR